MNAPTKTTQTRPELTMKRIFDAPRELVYACWTEQEHMKHWFFPKDFTVPHSESNIRQGGSYRSCLRAPNGTDNWVGGVYKELTPPEKIVFTHAWQDEAGNAEHETLVTITLDELGNKTRLTFHQAFFLTESSRDGHEGGWTETFDSLETYLAAKEAV
jgi:uncharacterized protein YndB with AHSA1/START domain